MYGHKEGFSHKYGTTEQIQIGSGREVCDLVARSAHGASPPRTVSGHPSRTSSGQTQRRARPDQGCRARQGNKRAGLGPSAAFSEALRAQLPALNRYARRMCGNADLADDMVQEACLKAWSFFEQYDPAYPLRPWLFRILRNEYLQYKRKHWRMSDVDIEPILEGLASEPEQAFLSDAHLAIQALDCLQPEYKRAFTLVVAGGFTYNEASKLCDCASGTIKSRVNRARAALQELLATGQFKSDARPKPDRDFSTLMDEIDRIKDVQAKLAA